MEYSDLNEGYAHMSFNPDAIYQNLESTRTESNLPPPPGFERTGNRVPLSPDELIAGVKEQLREFDQIVSQGGRPSSNPYQETVIYTTSEGKQVQVPPPLQEKAIEEWRAQKQMMEQERQRQMRAQEQQEQAQRQEPVTQQEQDNSRQNFLPPLDDPVQNSVISDTLQRAPRLTHVQPQPMPPRSHQLHHQHHLTRVTAPQTETTNASHIIWILIGMAVMYFLLTRNSRTEPVYAAVM